MQPSSTRCFAHGDRAGAQPPKGRPRGHEDSRRFGFRFPTSNVLAEGVCDECCQGVKNLVVATPTRYAAACKAPHAGHDIGHVGQSHPGPAAKRRKRRNAACMLRVAPGPVVLDVSDEEVFEVPRVQAPEAANGRFLPFEERAPRGYPNRDRRRSQPALLLEPPREPLQATVPSRRCPADHVPRVAAIRLLLVPVPTLPSPDHGDLLRWRSLSVMCSQRLAARPQATRSYDPQPANQHDRALPVAPVMRSCAQQMIAHHAQCVDLNPKMLRRFCHEVHHRALRGLTGALEEPSFRTTPRTEQRLSRHAGERGIKAVIAFAASRRK